MYYAIIYNRQDNIYEEFKVSDYDNLCRKLIDYSIKRLIDNKKINENDIIVERYVEQESLFQGFSFIPEKLLVVHIVTSNDGNFIFERKFRVEYYFEIMSEKAYIDSKL